MGHLESSLEWLRPLILGYNWDYCVVWKHGDDPSRFIEWVGCCCNGSSGNQEVCKRSIKIEDDDDLSIPACRDVAFLHPANTKSCQALARLPPFLSLYSGVHGETVISSQTRWLNIANPVDSEPLSEEFEGTRVLIPVLGGLLELFSTDHISENESVIEFVKAQFNSTSETETISNSTITIDEHEHEPYADTFNHLLTNQTLIPITRNWVNLTRGGSSTGSFPSEERPSRDSTPCSMSQAMDFTPLNFKDGSKEAEPKPCKSKNLLTERKRRKRISDGMLTLRSIVPKITKMHKAATLSDAIDYIKELENEKRTLMDEFEDSNMRSDDPRASLFNQEIVDPRGVVTSSERQLAPSRTKGSQSPVQVEVNKLGLGNFLVRVSCQQIHGAFTKLVEVLDSLDVLVVDVTSTVCNGTMSSSFIIQTNNSGIQENDLKDSLKLQYV